MDLMIEDESEKVLTYKSKAKLKESFLITLAKKKKERGKFPNSFFAHVQLIN